MASKRQSCIDTQRLPLRILDAELKVNSYKKIGISY